MVRPTRLHVDSRQSATALAGPVVSVEGAIAPSASGRQQGSSGQPQLRRGDNDEEDDFLLDDEEDEDMDELELDDDDLDDDLDADDEEWDSTADED